MNAVDDRCFMAEALRLAETGRFSTQPNPRVGCVIVQGGQIVGRGAHLRAGEAHAEVLALASAGERCRGATAYVTLEPCSHHGRTPPCSEALIAAGVARVVVAHEDPNPLVGGQGTAALREAGIVVDVGELADEAGALNAGFLSRMRRGRPRVTLKLAASLDARTAMASGESLWITSEQARRDVHRLRAESGAILTGIGTVLADDPSLTVRRGDLATLGRQPERIVLDRKLRMPASARMLGLDGVTRVFTASPDAERRREIEAAGGHVEQLPADGSGIRLTGVLERLGMLECNDVLVECGPTLAGAFVREGLVDRLVIYLAAHFMGHGARPLLKLAGLDSMAERLQWRFTQVRQVGGDLRVELEPGGT
jgi:diaminohydroxyphosphoribosylaminopyrimidine deaminase/5-amino-6-(5-phosphoribosylamino)uracil reductase